MEIFLANFAHKQPHCDAEMETIARTSKVITCDHTFKVSKYICASRGSDNKCMKQFENLFIALNEDHKVVGWRLTKSTSFEEIRDLLQLLNDCLDNPLQTVIVDDCCKVRNQYQSIFPGVVVKLDLFHAAQRVIKTFPKGSEWCKQISTVQLDNVWTSCDIDTTTVEGLSASTILMLENIDDMCNDTVTALLLKNTKTVHDMLEEINQQCNDRSFNAYDLPVKQSVGDDHVLASDAQNDPSSEHDHATLLQRNLSSFNLLIDPVEGDGDCTFRSIIKQLRHMLKCNDANTKLTGHLDDLGLTRANVDDDVFTLRQLFVDNIQSNEYYQMLLGISKRRT